MLTFFDLVDISEKYMDIINPSSREKLLKIGSVIGLKPGQRVLDLGCGFGETLALWADVYGINGVGIDIRKAACERAVRKMIDRGLSDRIEIVCQDAASYVFEHGSFDAAVCIGATFIWPDGFRDTLQVLSSAVKSSGRLVIGEATWRNSRVPPELALKEKFPTEPELLQIIREEEAELLYVIHASQDDWDRYESDNWYGLIRWLEENPGHPDALQVAQHLHTTQEEYLTVGREFYQWALYALCANVPK